MPVVAPAIAELGALVALLVALGFLLVAHQIVTAFFGVTKTVVDKAVGWVPWLGKKAVGGVLAVEKRVNSYLSEAIEALEAGVAGTWHTLAHTIAWLGSEIAHTARAAYRLWWTIHVKYPISVMWWGVKKLAHAAPAVEKRLGQLLHKTVYVTKVITKPLGGPIAAGVKAGTKTLTARVGRLDRWTRARIAGLEAAIAVELPNALERLGGDVWNLRRSLGNVWKWTRRHERALGSAAMTAAVAIALRRLGATWVRCGNWRRAGKAVCGMNPAALEDLLGLTIAVLSPLSIRELALAVQEVTEEATDAVRWFAGDE